jgi:hypothetical protein
MRCIALDTRECKLSTDLTDTSQGRCHYVDVKRDSPPTSHLPLIILMICSHCTLVPILNYTTSLKIMTVAVSAVFKAPFGFSCSNAGITVSYLTQGTDICPSVHVLILSCVGREDLTVDAKEVEIMKFFIM